LNTSAAIDIISPDYFHTMGVRVIAGRDLTPQDSAEAPRVVMLNQACARRFFSDDTPLGKHIQIAGMDSATIVGVVADLKQAGLVSPAEPAIFATYLQVPQSYMAVVVRSAGNPLDLVPAVRSQVQRLDKNLPVSDVATMEQLMSQDIQSQRFNTVLLGIFAGLALVLAAVGVYGVMNYNVTEHTHEIGIRMALGAQTRDVLNLVLWRGMVLAAIGIAMGLTGALALTGLLASLLYGVRPTDPATFTVVSLGLIVVALAACYIPATRATKVDPINSLRYE
jgi:putative ABC transport system permease protein